MRNNSSYGYRIETLPIEESINHQATPFRKPGKHALFHVGKAGWITHLEFPIGAGPRGNHYHKLKNERLYVASGALHGFFRPAGRVDLPIEEHRIEAGSVISLDPMCSHAFIALEDAQVVEWSSEEWALVKDDVHDDVLVFA